MNWTRIVFSRSTGVLWPPVEKFIGAISIKNRKKRRLSGRKTLGIDRKTVKSVEENQRVSITFDSDTCRSLYRVPQYGTLHKIVQTLFHLTTAYTAAPNHGVWPWSILLRSKKSFFFGLAEFFYFNFSNSITDPHSCRHLSKSF